MGKTKVVDKPYLTLPNHNHTKISLDPLPFPIMLTIAVLFFAFLAILFTILPSTNHSSERAYATTTTVTK